MSTLGPIGRLGRYTAVDALKQSAPDRLAYCFWGGMEQR